MFNLTKVISSIVLGFVCVALFIMPVTSAESLWSDTGANSNLFSDHKARNVGDVLTILISENSSAKRNGTASNSKSTSADMDVQFGIFGNLMKFLGLSSVANPSATASSENSDKFSANGSISNSNTVKARMTAEVVEVKPNGNLGIVGKQRIEQNGEEQTITVSGVVRREDILPDNSVVSSLIGNAQIKIDGKGPIAKKQRQGFITQLMNIFF